MHIYVVVLSLHTKITILLLQSIPEEGIRIFGNFLHTHLAGKYSVWKFSNKLDAACT